MTTSQKITLFVGIAAAVALFLMGRCNGIQSVTKRTGIDTTISHDSAVIAWIPIPIIVKHDTTIYRDKIRYLEKWDTLWGLGPEVVKNEIPQSIQDDLKDYYATRFYSDTQILKRGKAIINDTVYRNRIAGRQLQLFGTDTTINKVTVLRPPKRAIGYFTLSAMGNPSQPLMGAGTGFGLKLPNDMIYQGEVKLVMGHRPVFEGRVMFPIKLIKRN